MAAEIEDDVTADEGDAWFTGDAVFAFPVATTDLAAVPIDVTLLVDGMVISGRLLDELTYISRLAELLWRQDGLDSQLTPVDPDLAARLKEQIRVLQPDAGISSEYVHLEHVTSPRSAGDVTHLELWRGSFEDVSGWGIGDHHVSDPSPVH